MPGFARPCSPLKGKAVAVVAAAALSRRAMEKRQFLCLDFDPSCMESCFLLATSLQTLQFTQVFCSTSVLLAFFVRYLDVINTLLSLPFRRKKKEVIIFVFILCFWFFGLKSPPLTPSILQSPFRARTIQFLKDISIRMQAKIFHHFVYFPKQDFPHCTSFTSPAAFTPFLMEETCAL